MTDLGKLPLGKFAHLGKYSWESCPGKAFFGKVPNFFRSRK